ncbi:hypothetical protein E2562_011374 [Oryza meyeriana var. granulata]|uniref:Aspartic peptidase DDI1-type domain-containing protein n=1 Tax=Oryza meyeriana var. granulata TaxID=110450 RepID=A0A6G1EB22_9ORYZ|nr:hypothetical protein E2562_011374 [Oryza meyeriana var. granulata]
MEIDDDEANNDDAADNNVEISLLAFTGINMGNVMQLAVFIGGSTLHAMVDMGSTHCFFITAVAQRLGLCPTLCPGLSVGVANGERLPSSGVCRVVPVRIGKEMFDIDIYIMDLGGYEMVLGCYWLCTLVETETMITIMKQAEDT